MNALIGFLRHFFVSAIHKEKREWEIIFYCLGTAFLFWFLNAMGKVYQYPIKVPVEFQYSKNNILPLSSLPKTIDVLVIGSGWELARTKINWDRKPVLIPVKNPLETSWLIPMGWSRKVREVIPGVQVEAVLSDTIFCRFDRIEIKKVGLYVDLKDIQLKPGFQISSPVVINPRFIEFKGAAALIKNLPETLPVKIDARNINQSFDQNIKLDFSEEYPENELLTHELEIVNIQFSVRPSLEEEIDIPISLINSSAQPHLVLMERKVLVTFLVSQKDKPLIKVEDFEVVADMETFNKTDSTVSVRLIRKPNFVSDVQLGTEKTKVYAP